VRISWNTYGAVKYGMELVEHAGKFGFEETIARDFRVVGQNEKDEWLPCKHICVDIRYSAAVEYGFRYLLTCPLNLRSYWRHCLLEGSELGMVPQALTTYFPLSHGDVWLLEAKGLSERHPLLRNQTYLSHYSCLLSLSLSLSLLSKCRLSPVYVPQQIP
jgi:hypothetical protein